MSYPFKQILRTIINILVDMCYTMLFQIRTISWYVS